MRVHLLVATLGYSRRVYVRAFRHERQSAWFDGIEGAFRHFGGLPAEVLLDNAKALVEHHDAGTRVEPRGSPEEVLFNERFHAFTRYWGVRPVACAPYRARTKGKDERGVGYAKGNAIAGRGFASWAALEAHLAWWMREVRPKAGQTEVADVRVHGTTSVWPAFSFCPPLGRNGRTGEALIVRFEREEAAALRPLTGRPPFRQLRELTRRVQVEPRGSPENDGCWVKHLFHPRTWTPTTTACRGASSAPRSRATISGAVGASAPWMRPTCAASSRGRWGPRAWRLWSRPAPICCGPWRSMSRRREARPAVPPQGRAEREGWPDGRGERRCDGASGDAGAAEADRHARPARRPAG